MFDYHVHLWDHQHYSSMQATVEQLAEYCEQARSAGVHEIAITEHASRFLQIDEAVRGWWDDDPRGDRRAETVASWDEELGVDLDQCWDKPCAEAYPSPTLLSRFHALGVPITTASDGHNTADVAFRIGDLVDLAVSAGYRDISRFQLRRRESVPLAQVRVASSAHAKGVHRTVRCH